MAKTIRFNFKISNNGPIFNLIRSSKTIRRALL